MFASQSFHEASEKSRLSNNRKNSYGRYEHGHGLFRKVHDQPEIIKVTLGQEVVGKVKAQTTQQRQPLS